MPYTDRYLAIEPTRDELATWSGTTLLEFGAPWCGICQAAQPLVAAALGNHPGVRHAKIEDGRGRPLGRSFAVKLWPTLVLMRDGEVLGRWVRPQEVTEIAAALAAADTG
jgi:thioredoxin 1